MAADQNVSPEDALTRSLAESISRRYPGRLDDSQIEAIRRALEPVVNQLTVLRQYRLTNADEPDPIFRAFRGGG